MLLCAIIDNKIQLVTIGGASDSLDSADAPALYRLLLEKAGFKFSRVIPTNSNVSIVEAIPA